ncbi:flavin reductase family protein [Rhizobium halophytocola]|uniref:Flavin reductase (DIM6/NTAB) family NADH-FMN oxidoreductase RutF n=1 Tax=Rhizobium halophytocola TaxID=735519 RepID=A0ABS4DX12_9HYPH|nr:flavin reductase (DIM6/NTAB) family NADH-FMN oxidoreductase RutF [Rhizobium halophytocola]
MPHPAYAKSEYPVARIRHFLEAGPTVLISSSWRNRSNIMAHGWLTVMEFSPSLVGAMISAGNHSFEMIRASEECVINIPDASLVDTVAKIGNSSGAQVDKFAEFGLTKMPADAVEAPLIGECFASFECHLHDGRLIDDYNFFIFEVVKAHVSDYAEEMKMLHYRGDGIFTLSGETIERKALFTKVS